MEKIKFLASDEIFKGRVKLNSNILSINFEKAPSSEILTSGILLLNENNGRIQGRYEEFITVYRIYEDDPLHVEFSNDGSVYVPYVPVVMFNTTTGGSLDGVKEQKAVSFEELIIPIPVAKENYEFVTWVPEIPSSGEIEKDMRFRAVFRYVPTEEELKAAFEESKIFKVNESKILLESYLKENPLVSTCHNGVEATYTITSEKQTLMSNNYLTYMISKQSGVETELTWNATGKECEPWTEAEFLQLVLEVQAFVKPLVSLQQKYEVAIMACETQEELDSIVISYAYDTLAVDRSETETESEIEVE